jgi:hypothetical protein
MCLLTLPVHMTPPRLTLPVHMTPLRLTLPVHMTPSHLFRFSTCCSCKFSVFIIMWIKRQFLSAFYHDLVVFYWFTTLIKLLCILTFYICGLYYLLTGLTHYIVVYIPSQYYLLTGLTHYIVVYIPSQYFLRHMSWSFLWSMSSVEMRGDCSFFYNGRIVDLHCLNFSVLQFI